MLEKTESETDCSCRRRPSEVLRAFRCSDSAWQLCRHLPLAPLPSPADDDDNQDADDEEEEMRREDAGTAGGGGAVGLAAWSRETAP